MAWVKEYGLYLKRAHSQGIDCQSNRNRKHPSQACRLTCERRCRRHHRCLSSHQLRGCCNRPSTCTPHRRRARARASAARGMRKVWLDAAETEGAGSATLCERAVPRAAISAIGKAATVTFRAPPCPKGVLYSDIAIGYRRGCRAGRPRACPRAEPRAAARSYSSLLRTFSPQY